MKPHINLTRLDARRPESGIPAGRVLVALLVAAATFLYTARWGCAEARADCGYDCDVKWEKCNKACMDKGGAGACFVACDNAQAKCRTKCGALAERECDKQGGGGKPDRASPRDGERKPLRDREPEEKPAKGKA